MRVPATRSRKSSFFVPLKDCLSNSAAAADTNVEQRFRFYRRASHSRNHIKTAKAFQLGYFALRREGIFRAPGAQGVFRVFGREVLLPVAAKVPKNAIQTCGLKIRPRYGFLILIPCTTRSQNIAHVVPYDELTSLLRRCTPRVLVPLRFTAPLMRCDGRSVSVVRRWYQRQRRCC